MFAVPAAVAVHPARHDLAGLTQISPGKDRPARLQQTHSGRTR
jgi:hypothetical protein